MLIWIIILAVLPALLLTACIYLLFLNNRQAFVLAKTNACVINLLLTIMHDRMVDELVVPFTGWDEQCRYFPFPDSIICGCGRVKGIGIVDGEEDTLYAITEDNELIDCVQLPPWDLMMLANRQEDIIDAYQSA